MILQVGGQSREFEVVSPASPSTELPPLVFVFHGHGSSIEGAKKTFPVSKYWPEAMVVYPQGLLTPSRTDPEGKRTGWQKAPGDQEDRDLNFVDALLLSLDGQYDPARVYATGHSNGGSFCYLLWAVKSSVFTGFAPSGSSGTRLKQLPDRLRRPIIHIGGRKDFVVPFVSQEKAIQAVLAFNGCVGGGEAWDEFCTFYPGENPVATYITNRGHDFPVMSLVMMRRLFSDL
ncbi:MAG: esterase [Fimbriimonadaceae bacterium]